MLENILLQPEQQELLSSLVEAARNVPREQRGEFLVVRTHDGDSLLHSGLPGGSMDVYYGDIKVLASQGLLLLSYGSRGDPLFDVTPAGIAYYEHMKRSYGQPARQVEAEIRRYLDNRFQETYPSAYQRWAEAEERLWSSDSTAALTTIGHLCREAMQEFAAALVERHQISQAHPDKSRTVARVKAVLDQQKNRLGDSERELLHALLTYWGTANDLVQRQEHGAQREGQSLTWEDGRRVVFQTAIVMYEIDRSIYR